MDFCALGAEKGGSMVLMRYGALIGAGCRLIIAVSATGGCIDGLGGGAGTVTSRSLRPER